MLTAQRRATLETRDFRWQAWDILPDAVPVGHLETNAAGAG
jgi:hypothetical protein